MDKLYIKGKHKLNGEIRVSGAKNVAMKVILTSLLTTDSLRFHQIPHISSVYGTIDIVRHLGVKANLRQNTLDIQGKNIHTTKIPLECGGLYRTATMVIGPLLARFGEAIVPNPGGCRLGKRPIERHIEGLCAMGAKIIYKDGYFVAKAKSLKGTKYAFSRNSHTGTETLILAAVLAKGETILENASAEPEVDDLIKLLQLMGAKIKRTKERTIIISGVPKLHGTHFMIMPDRNEVVTFAIAALVTGGEILIRNVQFNVMKSFFEHLDRSRALWKKMDEQSLYIRGNFQYHSTNVVTQPHPGFMTDWQAPWAIFMTQAKGKSTLHETIYENRFGYVTQLLKMGACITYFEPKVSQPEKFYNFNLTDKLKNHKQGIIITGQCALHNALLEVSDLRAGATLVLAGLCADGESIIQGIDHIDRGYENLENRLKSLGAQIKRVNDA